jgi:hypothetical protein
LLRLLTSGYGNTELPIRNVGIHMQLESGQRRCDPSLSR